MTRMTRMRIVTIGVITKVFTAGANTAGHYTPTLLHHMSALRYLKIAQVEVVCGYGIVSCRSIKNM